MTQKEFDATAKKYIKGMSLVEEREKLSNLIGTNFEFSILQMDEDDRYNTILSGQAANRAVYLYVKERIIEIDDEFDRL